MSRRLDNAGGSGPPTRQGRMTAGHIGFGSLNITPEDLVEPPPRWQASSRMDFRPDILEANCQTVRDAYARFMGVKNQRPGALYVLMGLLNQHKAVEERVWFEQALKGALRAHEHRLRRAGVRSFTFLVTIVPASGAVPIGQLHRTDLVKLRKVMQRYARALPPDSFFAGMLEPDVVVDRCAESEHWQWHAHFIVLAPAKSPGVARRLIRKAIPVKADMARGICKPRDIRRIRHSLGGLDGAVAYISKSLQVHALHRKVITRNAKTGKRGHPSDQKLSADQLAEWAGFAAKVEADALMVWSGYRRYGERLVQTSGHGGGRPKSKSKN